MRVVSRADQVRVRLEHLGVVHVATAGERAVPHRLLLGRERVEVVPMLDGTVRAELLTKRRPDVGIARDDDGRRSGCWDGHRGSPSARRWVTRCSERGDGVDRAPRAALEAQGVHGQQELRAREGSTRCDQRFEVAGVEQPESHARQADHVDRQLEAVPGRHDVVAGVRPHDRDVARVEPGQARGVEARIPLLHARRSKRACLRATAPV